MVRDMPTRSSLPSDGASPAEVVVGLVNDDSAEAVTRAAVGLSRRYRAPIRFVHVVPPGAPESETADENETAFITALRFLGCDDGQRVIFESPAGDAARTLVARSRRALVLVVGEDDIEHARGDGGIAAHCLRYAHSQVHVVPYRSPGSP